MCISGRARGVRLFFRVRGAHPIARLRSLVVPPRHPNYADSGFRVPTPQTPLARGASVFFFTPEALDPGGPWEAPGRPLRAGGFWELARARRCKKGRRN